MSTRVYIGRLHRDVRERDIEKITKEFGPIRDISLKQGFGFVEFRDGRDADDFVREYDGKVFFGDRLIAEPARGERRAGAGPSGLRYPPPSRTDYRVIVENLSSACSWQDLKDYMRSVAEVTFADIIRGDGVVEFSSYDDMRRAIRKLDDTDLKGRRIRIFEDRGRRDERDRSRSRSPRYRSRSPRRSPEPDRQRDRSPPPADDEKRAD